VSIRRRVRRPARKVGKRGGRPQRKQSKSERARETSGRLPASRSAATSPPGVSSAATSTAAPHTSCSAPGKKKAARQAVEAPTPSPDAASIAPTISGISSSARPPPALPQPAATAVTVPTTRTLYIV